MLAPPPQRVADLRLRSSDGPMRTRVWWPASREAGMPTGLLLFFVDAAVGEQDWLRELATEAQVVIVAAPCAQDSDAIVRARVRDGTAALEWAAEHAGQLEADPGACSSAASAWGPSSPTPPPPRRMPAGGRRSRAGC